MYGRTFISLLDSWLLFPTPHRSPSTVVHLPLSNLLYESTYRPLSLFSMKVNGWAFARVVDGPGSNSYWHPMFLRGLPCLAYKMKRPPKTKNSAASVRSSHSGGFVSESPDFGRIAQIAPLPASFVFSATANGIIPVPSNQEIMGDGFQDDMFPLGITPTPPVAPVAGAPKLSTADVQYLAQQNRLFDRHIFNNPQQDSDKQYWTEN